MTIDLTPLDEIRARTKSVENSRLRALKVEPDPVMGINAVLLRSAADVDGYYMNILEIMSGPHYETPVVKLETAHQIVAAARDAHALMLIVDAIKTTMEQEAADLRITADRLTQDALKPPTSTTRADRQQAREDAERYRNFSSWADSVAYKIPKIIDSILSPKEDTPNE
ncbi:hypothetical protein SEA_LYMARA_60 [Arthrobacter phage Lymara]|uniref:Uncharacterized protein n=1 Tax=Arthrobacter phage Lymara TaxID=2599828 RepID=A0A5J6TVN6_9CAUD|nr:hypothetical protein HYQ01_gp060 [Arthrobacter phage Lymara]QFG14861.1 hypothetical protein SEA_LYMARA_60 [Arthrobacter phage Lymara]